ncbi:hypothetical protein [Pseudomonas putida]|uniref:hypothetical protein n=1 Tax=Pseudomonas putida TaxID=303 RepID=UPI00330F20AC|nr:hypothetical protein [Pseudomonas putida]
MTHHRRMQLMLRNPRAMMEFSCTGRLPADNTPASPLIALIESIPPRYRTRITSVVVGPALGYQGHHRFHNLAQALNWLKPSHVSASYPSESWRLKRFSTALTIKDLAQHCQLPEQIEKELTRTR